MEEIFIELTGEKIKCLIDLKALVWLRNQTIIANKNLLVQVLMPYGLLFIYKNFMNLGGQPKGLDLMFPMFISSYCYGSTVSTIVLKKRKNNLKTLLLSGAANTNILYRF